jgi:hypothetical protein
VSFRPASADSALVEWGGGDFWQLGLEETDHRVRYCARGMDQASERDTRMDGEPRLDCYLLQFWPAPPEPDRVLKQTSQVAAYWHRYARELPPPPTPAERAEAERQARLAQERAERERRLAFERWQWGGQPPSQALRDVGGNVRGLLEFDPALVHAIDASGPATQREVALFAARRACEAAGLTALDWVADALTALAEGRPLPPPFDDDARMWQTLATDPRVPDRTVGRAVPPERPPFRPPASPGTDVPRALEATQAVVGPAAAVAKTQASGSGSSASAIRQAFGSHPSAAAKPQVSGSGLHAMAVTFGPPDPSVRMSQPHMALPAVTDAAGPDPLRAALDAVFAAVVTYGENHPALLAEVWSVVRGTGR